MRPDAVDFGTRYRDVTQRTVRRRVMPESNPIKILSGILPCRGINPLKKEHVARKLRPSLDTLLFGWLVFRGERTKASFQAPTSPARSI